MSPGATCGASSPRKRQHILRIAPAQQRVHVPPDRQPVIETRLGKVLRRIGGGMSRRLIQHDAERCGAALAAQRLQRDAVTQQQVMRYLHRRLLALQAGREGAGLVAEDRDDPRFVVRGDRGRPAAEAARDFCCIVRESANRVAIHPAADFLQRLGQVPVVQREVGRDVPLEQCVDEPVVEVEALFVPLASAERLDSWPRDRKPIGIHAEAGNQPDVLADAVVVIACTVAAAAVPDRAGPTAELIPDRVPASIFMCGALDLVGARRHAPDEIPGKALRDGAGFRAEHRVARILGRFHQHGVIHGNRRRSFVRA